jgi:hypothetical protein
MTLRARWNRYWFAPGGRIAAAVLRIALAIAALWTLRVVVIAEPVAHPGAMSADVYHPVGLLLLFPSPPPAFVVDAAVWIALVAGIAMLVGAWSRAAAATTTVALWLVCSQAMSYQPTWGHHLNVVVLALIAFTGARGGDALSIDAWRRRRAGAPIPDGNYQWSIRLVQLAVVLMFLSALAFKLGAAYFTPRWALSDNLRHQILARYDLIGVPRTPVADWLVDGEWRWKIAALLNLAAQGIPFLAVFFVNRPRLRAICGAFFVVEVVGLGVVMGLWNLHWLPLAAVFVDWDRLLRPSEQAASIAAPAPRAAAWFVALFVVYDVVVSFTFPRIDQRLRTFPFSAYPMFATVRATPPYGEHRDYDFVFQRIELVADRAIPPDVQAAIDRDYVYRSLHRETDRDVLRTRLGVVVEQLRRRYPDLGLRGVRLYITSYRAPAYPAPARLEPYDLAIAAEIVDGTFRSALSPIDDAGRFTRPPDNLVLPATLLVYRNTSREATVLDGRLPDARMLHVVADVGGRRYLVYRKRSTFW